MAIFRAVPRKGFISGQEKTPYTTIRLPGNVPYLVDNLWELARPDSMPSRRFAVYASPTPELALKSATAGDLARDQYVVCHLEFAHPPAMIQLSVADAREHADIRRLQKFVNDQLNEWVDSPVVDKLPLAALFLPGISKVELQAAMQQDATFNKIATAARDMVRLWSEYPDKKSLDGELFFEMGADNSYRLVPVA